MLFNSWTFALFAIGFFSIYFCAMKTHGLQNWILLAASYIFYGAWDYRFLFLIFFSTIVDYALSRKIHSLDPELPGAGQKRKQLLWVSIGTNMAVLGFFKYFNFFADSTVRILNAFGIQADAVTLNIILPVGISFYTFQTMSYTIDVYRGHLPACRSLRDYALYLSFFPQLVAGPIERAESLLRQVQSPRRVRWPWVGAGLHLILLGLFKKVFVADNCASIANQVFDPGSAATGFDLIIGLLAFTFQIYGDFSGYSDIARGLAYIMGFRLMINFKLPYFSISPSDFWRRWHISLSSWLRDYLYIPLGGNRGGGWKTARNLMVTMLLGGLWHGAAWNFIIWGGYWGVLVILYHIFDSRPHPARAYGPLNHLSRMSIMFILITVGWLFFRCSSLAQISGFFANCWRGATGDSLSLFAKFLFFVSPLVVLEIYQQWKGNLLAWQGGPLWVRSAFAGILILLLLLFGSRTSTEFIYFQF